jgi:hypothetical protein
MAHVRWQKLQINELEEQLVDKTLLATTWQWKEQSMRVYSRQRDESIYNILAKPLNKKKQKQFIAVLKKTALVGVDDDANDTAEFPATIATV